MAPPACDRDYDRCIVTLWTPENHRKCFLMTRMVVHDIIMQNRHRRQFFGMIPKEICMRILRQMRVVIDVY